MALPKIAAPQYSLKLPSTGKNIKFRPFLVKEEKLLLMAMETSDENSTIETIKQIIKDCTNITVPIDSLPTFDIEYIFLKIRSKSVGESSKVILTAPDDGETEVTVEINLAAIEISEDDEHDKTIKLSDNMGMVMKYPSLDTFVKMNITGDDERDEITQVFDLASDCIDNIYDENQVYPGSDSSKQEKIEFLEQLTSEQFQMVQKFFETMPKLMHDVEVVNPNTNVTSTVTLEGLASFFG
ncbi:baseplate hub [Synechococcus phage S-ShM2]|uniref:Baseplate hub subunit n=3 Tax=Ahtivirus sagseatwo TaxID=2734079 RepID=A0A1D7SHP9_9CAUD|nr:baseplate hub [Synechococcus phage S-ShM2]AGH57330.1 baseplate hub subunit [Cyanophage S-SSM2]AOO13123.1 baseplate hub subunit [Cyanophage S-RIM14]ADO97622.1 baseplate hub subunit [Synechococcus phage S-ShM2]AOO13339.1 baseplate hub subunit [Cyanophage S-RIM14]AOO13555.1 baseplate hub subunit [Cyanophage S-RIM14]